MRKLLISTTALSLSAFGAQAASVSLMSWGGDYGLSQTEAYLKPFTAETGIETTMVDADNPAVPLKAMVEANNVTIDVFDVELSDALRLCDEGLVEVLPMEELPAGADGTPAASDFIDGALTDCAVGSIVWSTVVAYNTETVGGASTLADFFDITAFPGKRGLRKGPKANLEMALVADGVPANEVYAMLDTDEGVDRAFAKLDTIKDNVVWWEAGSQPPQLLADGEVVMSTAYNGRLFSTIVMDKKPLDVIWDGQIIDLDMFVIPKGAPNKDAAWQFIKYATQTKPLADQARWIPYGPARKSSAPLVGKYKDDVTDMGPHMPTAPANLTSAILNDSIFWADKDIELSERFNAWLLQ